MATRSSKKRCLFSKEGKDVRIDSYIVNTQSIPACEEAHTQSPCNTLRNNPTLQAFFSRLEYTEECCGTACDEILF